MSAVSDFAERLPRVVAAIERCSFLAIDCEFSGLSSAAPASRYDRPEQRYAHLRRTAADFLVIQFGLSAFTLDKQRKRYSQDTFNFFLFPRDASQGSFLCQPSSLEFLAGNGFDFNRLIRDGMPYLRPAQLEQLREQLERQLERQLEEQTEAAAGRLKPDPVPDSQAEFVNKAVSQIEEFLLSEEEHLDFDGLTGYQRKLLYDNVPARVAVPLELETRRSACGQRTLRLGRAVSAAEREASRRRQLERRLDEAAGFSRVVTAISQSGKTVVGHNMLLDLLHIVHQFICPLPDTYAEFKSVVTCIFPSLVDTKVMGSTQPFRDLVASTQLSEMAVCLAGHPFNMPTVVAADGAGAGAQCSLADGKHHQAGFDAFVTAMCFGAMVSYLGLLLQPPQPLLEPTADIIKPFTNKIFAMRMADTPYLNLTGADVIPSRHHVFYLTFPSHWRTSDIVHLFSAFSSVHVQWINDTSAFVSLDRRDQASQVVQNVKATGLFTLCTYAEWQAKQRESQSSGAQVARSDSAPPASASPAAGGASPTGPPPAANTRHRWSASATSRHHAPPTAGATPTASPAADPEVAAAAPTVGNAADAAPSVKTSTKKRKRRASGRKTAS